MTIKPHRATSLAAESSSTLLASCGGLSICSSSSLVSNLSLSDWHMLLFILSRDFSFQLLCCCHHITTRCFATSCLYPQQSLFQLCILSVCRSLPTAFHPLSPSSVFPRCLRCSLRSVCLLSETLRWAGPQWVTVCSLEVCLWNRDKVRVKTHFE